MRGEHPNSRANLQKGRPRPIHQERQKEIVRAYPAMSLEEMRERFRLTRERIKKVLVANGVRLRPRGTNSLEVM